MAACAGDSSNCRNTSETTSRTSDPIVKTVHGCLPIVLAVAGLKRETTTLGALSHCPSHATTLLRIRSVPACQMCKPPPGSNSSRLEKTNHVKTSLAVSA